MKTKSGHQIVGKCVFCNKYLNSIHVGKSNVTSVSMLHSKCFRKHFGKVDEFLFEGTYQDYLDELKKVIIDSFKKVELKQLDPNINVYSFLNCIACKTKTGKLKIWYDAHYDKETNQISGYHKGLFNNLEDFIEIQFISKL